MSEGISRAIGVVEQTENEHSLYVAQCIFCDMNMLYIVEYWYACYGGLIPATTIISAYLLLLVNNLYYCICYLISICSVTPSQCASIMCNWLYEPSVCFFATTLFLYRYLTFPQLPCENICFFTHLLFYIVIPRLPLYPIYF